MKRLFSLSIILVALIFWASHVLETKNTLSTLSSDDPHYVDVFIRDFTITAMDADGQPGYILKAQRLEHYSDKDYAVISAPEIELRQNQHRWIISARSGEINDDTQHITLMGEVIARQQDKPYPLRLETDLLEIDIDEQTAKSIRTVSIIQHNSHIKSEGMILNNATGQLEFLNSVEGSYARPQ